VRFYGGLAVALLGPVLALLLILYILRHGFTGYLTVFAVLGLFGLLTDLARQRRRRSSRPHDQEGGLPSAGGMARGTASTAWQVTQAAGVDLLGTAAAMAGLVAIALVLAWVSHFNLVARPAIAGSVAQSSNATLSLPGGIAIGRDGSMYITDEHNLQVDRFSPSGNLATRWARAGRIDGFRWPVRLAIDATGHLYVADAQAGRIDVVSARGVRLTSWSMPDAFDEPMGLAFGRRGNLYVALLAADRIEKLSPSGKVLASFGGFGDGPGQFNEPSGIAIAPSGVIYVLDTLNNRVQTFSPSLRYITSWGRAQDDSPGDFSHPSGITIDAAGHVYIADTDNHRIEKFSPNGRLLAVWGRYGHDTDEFDSPHGIAVDRHGNVYVADTYNHRIVKLNPAGHVLATYQSLSARPHITPRAVAPSDGPIMGAPPRSTSPILAWIHVFVP
jgi:DNA-binding beta-propeller fold protein YncE